MKRIFLIRQYNIFILIVINTNIFVQSSSMFTHTRSYNRLAITTVATQWKVHFKLKLNMYSIPNRVYTIHLLLLTQTNVHTMPYQQMKFYNTRQCYYTTIILINWAKGRQHIRLPHVKATLCTLGYPTERIQEISSTLSNVMRNYLMIPLCLIGYHVLNRGFIHCFENLISSTGDIQSTLLIHLLNSWICN